MLAASVKLVLCFVRTYKTTMDFYTVGSCSEKYGVRSTDALSCGKRLQPGSSAGYSLSGLLAVSGSTAPKNWLLTFVPSKCCCLWNALVERVANVCSTYRFFFLADHSAPKKKKNDAGGGTSRYCIRCCTDLFCVNFLKSCSCVRFYVISVNSGKSVFFLFWVSFVLHCLQGTTSYRA